MNKKIKVDHVFTEAVLTIFISLFLLTGMARYIKPIWTVKSSQTIHNLPNIFRSALHALKNKSRIPILLPSKLPLPFRLAKYIHVDILQKNQYGISIYYKMDIGDAGFAGSFYARKYINYSLGNLPNVHPIVLIHNIQGYFRAVSCGGSCAPANLWWNEYGVVYQIQLSISPNIRYGNQMKLIIKIANSAISAGPR